MEGCGLGKPKISEGNEKVCVCVCGGGVSNI